MESISTDSNGQIDLERKALYLALSELLDDGAMEAVFAFFTENHVFSMDTQYPTSRSEIERALEQFFKSGTSVIMTVYDSKFYQLTSSKEAVA